MNILGKTSFGQRQIVTDGLTLYLDAANPKSYSGTGTIWTDLSGNGINFTMENSTMWDSAGIMTLADSNGAIYSGNITTSTTCTFVVWMKTTDTQALFLRDIAGHYLGAHREGNKEYSSSNFGSPDFRLDTVSKSNIYDYLPDNNWHMVEYKNVNLSFMTDTQWNNYSGYTFGSGAVSIIQIYNKVLSQSESIQNYNAIKHRFI